MTRPPMSSAAPRARARLGRRARARKGPVPVFEERVPPRSGRRSDALPRKIAIAVRVQRARWPLLHPRDTSSSLGPVVRIALIVASVPGCASFLGDFSPSDVPGADDGGVPDSSISGTTDARATPSAEDGQASGATDGSAPNVADAASPAQDGAAATGIFCEHVGASCSCTAPDGRPGGGPPCSETTVTNAVCCADPTWPATATTCACKPYGCTSSIEGCECGENVSDAAATSCLPGSGETCCASASTSSLSCDCAISNGSCYGQEAVSGCSAQTQPCAPTQVRITSCSP